MSEIAEQQQAVRALVARYLAGRHGYVSSAYKEEQARADFIDPLLRQLEWDVDNVEGLSPDFRQVRRADPLRHGADSVKAPDYGLYIGGTRLIFVEAKKPSVDITKATDPALQLRSYGWSAKLPISVLTNVEHLAVYDCRRKPKLGDLPRVSRLVLISIEELADRWEEVRSLLARSEVVSGRSRLAIKTAHRGGEVAVDDAFLDDMETWRLLLATQIVKHNEGLDAPALNHAVQLTLDRIIFLRICEDRGIEPRGRLHDTTRGDGVHKRMQRLFRAADDRYNSGLFHFTGEKGRSTPKDDLTPRLDIPDAVLREIVEALYWPKSQYRFEMLSAEILGSVYERFLGREIVLSGTGRTARVADKPHTRESKGVYYTPQYVVRHLLDCTLGEVLRGCSTPEDALDITVCDPACGSGSFLLEAYQMLLDWHLDRHLAAGKLSPAKATRRGKANPLRKNGDGGFRLTTAARKEILLRSIYGVDLDPQAVEVTKLSLLLKVLEDESAASLFPERALPDLGANVRCGNSLISTDVAGLLLDNGESEALEATGAMDWQRAFPGIFSRRDRGFSVVIGNPPYLNLKRQFLSPLEKQYFDRHYATAKGQYDAFVLFSERALNVLAPGGRHAFVLPKPVLASENYRPLRELFLAHSVEAIVDLGQPFRDASVEAISVCCKKSPPVAASTSKLQTLAALPASGSPRAAMMGEVPQHVFSKLPECSMPYLLTAEAVTPILKLFSLPTKIGDLISITRGAECGKSTEGVHGNRKSSKRFKPLLRGEDVTAYKAEYGGFTIDVQAFDARDLKPANLYEDGPKLLIRRVAGHLMAAIDREGNWALNTLYVARPKRDHAVEVLAAILNSRLLSAVHRLVYLGDDKLFPYIRQSQIDALPAPPHEKLTGRSSAELVKVVRNIESVASSGKGPTVLIGLLDTAEALVRELYGLTEAECEALQRAAFRE